jgi:hypothetical protein
MFVPLSEPKADSVGLGCVHYDVLLAVIVLTTPGVVEATGGRGEGVIDRGGDRGRSFRAPGQGRREAGAEARGDRRVEQGRREESEAGGGVRAPDPPPAFPNPSLFPMGL